MPVEIVVPQLGESVVDATLARWLKKPGDRVEAGEAVVALETDKVDLEVPADQGGVLSELRRQEGDTVVVGEVLGIVTQGASAPEPAADTNGSSPAEQLEGSTGTHLPTLDQSPATGAKMATPAESAPADVSAAAPPEAAATPLARSIAEKHDLDLSQVPGTGPHGRVTRDDVAHFMEHQEQQPLAGRLLAQQANPLPLAAAPVPPSPAPPAVPPSPAPPAVPPPAAVPAPAMAAQPADPREERRKMSRRRQTIATRLVEAQHTAAMLTTFNEVDMSAVMAIRKRRKDAFKEKHGVGLGFMSFFTRAAIGALKVFPLLNAEIQGDEIVVKHYYDVGIAVSTDEGLVVPVVRDADRLSFAGIERSIEDLAKRARGGQLTLNELRGGTFTITNGGIFGSLLSTPILNTPQVGILGMHKIEERPVAVNGEVVVRPMMYLALSYDHRIVDGAEAVRFLVKVKELIEDPEALLLEG